MATKTTTPATAAPASEILTDSPWGEAEVLGGVDLLDKAELIGVPFLLTGIKWTINDRDIIIVWVEGEREDHSTFTFTDTSTGVRAQIEAYAAVKGISTDANGDWHDVRLIAPKGLRVSTYTVKDERQKDREARTYYLTTSGKRA